MVSSVAKHPLLDVTCLTSLLWDPEMFSRRKSLYSVLENEEVFSRPVQVGWSPKVVVRSSSRLEVRGAHGLLEDQ